MEYKKNPLEKRKQDCEKVIKKFPNKIPVMVTKHVKSTLPNLDKEKFLVPNDISVGNFHGIIRKKLVLEPQYGLNFFVGGKVLPKQDSLMQDVYNSLKDEDGFLYIEYAEFLDKGSFN